MLYADIQNVYNPLGSGYTGTFSGIFLDAKNLVSVDAESNSISNMNLD